MKYFATKLFLVPFLLISFNLTAFATIKTVRVQKISMAKSCATILLRFFYAIEPRHKWEKRIKQTSLENVPDLENAELEQLYKIFKTMRYEQIQPDVHPFAKAFERYSGPREQRLQWLTETAAWAEQLQQEKISFGAIAEAIPEFAQFESYWNSLQQERWQMRLMKFFLPPDFQWMSEFSLFDRSYAVDGLTAIPQLSQKKLLGVNVYKGLETPWPIYMAGRLLEVAYERWANQNRPFITERMNEIYYKQLLSVDPAKRFIFSMMVPEKIQQDQKDFFERFFVVREILLRKLSLYEKLVEKFPQYRSKPWDQALAAESASAFFTTQLSDDYFNLKRFPPSLAAYAEVDISDWGQVPIKEITQ